MVWIFKSLRITCRGMWCFILLGVFALSQIAFADGNWDRVCDELDAALASYTPQQKKAAQEASATVKQILGMSFAMNQIFIMRHDLISAIIGQQGRVPLNY